MAKIYLKKEKAICPGSCHSYDNRCYFFGPSKNCPRANDFLICNDPDIIFVQVPESYAKGKKVKVAK